MPKATEKLPARHANAASPAPSFKKIGSLMSVDGHVNADGGLFLIDLARQTQKITKPTTGAQVIDQSAHKRLCLFGKPFGAATQWMLSHFHHRENVKVSAASESCR